LRKQFACLSLCMAIIYCSYAQPSRTPVSTVYTQLNSYSQNSDVFSFTANQAALASIKCLTGGFYGERRFMLEDLGLYKSAIAFPVSSGSFGFTVDYFGGQLYHDVQSGLAYGRKLSDKIDAGVQFNYYTVSTAGYGTAGAVNFEGGAIMHVTEQFSTGIHVYNPTEVNIGKNNEEKLPSIYTVGFGYDASKDFFIGTEVEKIEDQPININAGVQYQFDEKLYTRLGISSATSSFYFGTGVQLSGFRLDATASIHPHLGITPGLMIIFNPKERN
jgi:hypothetical protein